MKKLTVPESGSVAGVTASRNRYGQYNRTRAIPVNPSTPAQTSARNALGAASSAWRELDSTDQVSWNLYAATQPKVDSLGQTLFWSGMQSFVEQFILRLGIGVAAPVGPPAPVTFVPLTVGGVISVTGPSMLLSFSPTPVAAGFVLQVDATTNVSPGVSFFGPSDFRRVVNLAAATATDEEIIDDYLAVFGVLGPINNVIGVRIRLISVTGPAGPYVQGRLTNLV